MGPERYRIPARRLASVGNRETKRHGVDIKVASFPSDGRIAQPFHSTHSYNSYQTSYSPVDNTERESRAHCYNRQRLHTEAAPAPLHHRHFDLPPPYQTHTCPCLSYHCFEPTKQAPIGHSSAGETYTHHPVSHCHQYYCQPSSHIPTSDDKETTTSQLTKIVTNLIPLLEQLVISVRNTNEARTRTDSPAPLASRDSPSTIIPTTEGQPSHEAESTMTTPSSTSPESFGNRPAMSAGPFGFVMTMPQPGTPGTPFFQGKNVSEFLSRYEDMCEDYHVGNNERIRRLPRYCDMLIGQTIESLPDFVERRWTQLSKVMKKEYKAGDSIQQVNSRPFLESYKDKVRTSDDDVRNFCRKFGAISKALISQEKLDIYTRNQWFMQGLPADIREELFFRRGVDFDDNVMKDFDGLVKKTLTLVEARMKYKEVMRTEKSVTDKYSALADQFDKKIVLDGHENIMNSLSPPVADSTTVSLSKSTEKTIMDLTNKFDALVLATGAQMRPANQNSQQSQQSRNRSQSPHRQSSYDGQRQQHDHQYGSDESCNYCGEKVLHDRRRDCPDFDADQRNGVIHLNEKGLLCLGPMGTYSNPIRHLPGVTQKESIRRAKMLANQFSQAGQNAEVHTVRIGEDSADDFSSDEEWDPEVTIIEHTTSINSARTENNKPAEENWKEPAKRILKRRAEREDHFAVPKAPRYGNWSPLPTSVERRNDSLDQSKPTDRASAAEPRVTFADPIEEDVEMTEAGLAGKGGGKKKPGTGVLRAPIRGEVRDAIEKIGAEEFLKIARREFNVDLIQGRYLQSLAAGTGGLTNGNIIAMLPMFKSVVNKVTRNTEAERQDGPTVKIGSIGIRDPLLRRAYTRSTPKAKVRVGDGGRYKSLLDSGAEVNVMTYDVAKREGLAMRPYPNINLISHTGHRKEFLGVCENVEVDIGGVASLNHIFVIDAADHQLVLGQPYLHQMRVGLDYRNNEVECTIHAEDGKRTAKFIATSDPGSKLHTAEDLFPENRDETLN